MITVGFPRVSRVTNTETRTLKETDFTRGGKGRNSEEDELEILTRVYCGESPQLEELRGPRET